MGIGNAFLGAGLAAAIFASCLGAETVPVPVSRGARGPSTDVTLQRPEELIAKLNDDDFDVRDAAYQQLEALGDAACPALRKAASQQNEIGEAARRLLDSCKSATLDILAFDRDGHPAADAEADMTVHDSSGRQFPSDLIKIKEDGTVRIEDRRAGRYYTSFYWKNGFVVLDQTHTGWFMLKPGRTPSFFTLTRGATLKAVILDSDGKPLAGARLWLVPGCVDQKMADNLRNSQPSDTRLCKVSGEDGRVSLEEIPDGVYQYVVLHERHEPIVGAQLRIREGDDIELPLQWMTEQRNASIQFVVLRRDGTPLDRTQVGIEIKRAIFGPERDDPDRSSDNQRRLQQNTDDAGKLTISDILPGHYVFSLSAWDSNAQKFGMYGTLIYQPATVLVTSESAPEIVLTPSAGGSIFGRVIHGKGKGIRATPVLAIPEEVYSEPDFTPFDENGYPVHQNCRNEWTRGSGIFHFNQLNAGRYMLLVRTPTGNKAIVNEIEVKPGKLTVIPDIVFADEKETLRLRNIKGRVVLPDGTPATQAGIRVSRTIANQDSITTWQTCVAPDGSFNFENVSTYYDQWYATRKLSFFSTGYKPQSLDLEKFELGVPVLVKLEKHKIGRLLVQVADEAGKPLRDAVVSIANHNQVLHTDRNGRAEFSCLCEGERQISVSCEGYFQPGETVAKIAAEQDNQLAITMHTGLSIKGHLEVPAGVPASLCVVKLRSDDSVTHSQGIQEDGSFTFDGLLPGRHWLLAQAPGMLSAGETELFLPADQKAPQQASIRLFRASGVAVGVDLQSENCSVALIPSDWMVRFFENDWSIPLASNWTGADATGRAEFWGVVPGNYNVEITRGRDSSYLNNKYRIDLSAASILGRVNVGQMQSVSDLRSAPTIDVNPGGQTGTVLFHLDMKPAAAIKNRNHSYYVQFAVIGEKGAITSGAYLHTPKPDEHETMVIGKLPREFKPRKLNCYAVHNLPAGTYKLYIRNVNYADRNKRDSKNDPPPAPVVEFTLTEGQQADIGSIAIPPPPPEALGDANEEQHDFSADQNDVFLDFNP